MSFLSSFFEPPLSFLSFFFVATNQSSVSFFELFSTQSFHPPLQELPPNWQQLLASLPPDWSVQHPKLPRDWPEKLCYSEWPAIISAGLPKDWPRLVQGLPKNWGKVIGNVSRSAVSWSAERAGETLLKETTCVVLTLGSLSC